MTPHECKEVRKLLESYKRVNFDRKKRIQELIEENYELQKRIIELERRLKHETSLLELWQS